MIKTVIKTTLEVTGATTPVIPLGFMVPSAIAVEDAAVGTALVINAGDTTNVLPLYDQNGSPIDITLASTGSGVGVYSLTPDDFKGIKFIQIESNGIETDPIAITIYGYEP